jgi:hypothetical protein
MKRILSIAWLSLIVCLSAATITPLIAEERVAEERVAEETAAVETVADQRTFTALEQAAREKILNSTHWQETRVKFKQWASVQSAYDSKQLASQEAALKLHINSMSATELEQFLAAMEERLEVLLSPGMDQARSWVDHYYTEKAKHKIAKKLGVDQPLNMTGGQLTAALEQFQDQRESSVQSSSAFNRSRLSQDKALSSYRKEQQSAQAKARSASRSASFSSHAPVKTQKRKSRYPSGWRGGRGGWGGW